MLKGKSVLLGVTGSIAAYKIANLASSLVKLHADVTVLMTENATNFINPFTFETLTKNKCLIDTFDRNFQYSVEHVSIAKKADIALIAPASANVIGKIAGGIADDMLTTTIMACKCKVMIAPAMNTNMYENPILQDNLDKLRRFGYEIIEPDSGYLACGDTGKGKMPSEEVLLRGRFSSCIWNLGVFSERCTEKLPLRVDFIHRVEFGEVSRHRVLIKRGPGNRGPTECGTTHEATSGMSS